MGAEILDINKKQELLPHTHAEAVIYFMANMDIEMLNMLLDKERTYQDFPK